MSATGEHGRKGWREFALAALVLAALAALVLWRPLAHSSAHVLGAWDTISQSSSLTRLESTERIANPQLSDPGLQMAPWIELAASEVREGRAPTWNPFNGCGIPLLANYQSGVFSVFNAPYYFLPPKFAALTSALLKLWCSALAMYALLRSLQRTSLASLLGAVVYAFAGFQLVCLQHPHGGTLALAPAALACIELAFAAFERERTRMPWSWLAGAAIALGLAALSGHPETLAASAVVVFAWSAVRAIGLWRRNPAARSQTARFVGALATSGVLAIAISAVQIVPFLEYLRHGADTVALARNHHLAGRDLAFQIAPNLAGSPRDGDQLDPQTPEPNFQDSAAQFVGPLALLLALLALASPRLRRREGFWISLAVLQLFAVLDVPWLSDAVRRVALFDVLPALRLQPWLLFSVAALAAAAVDARRSGELAGMTKNASIVGLATIAGVALVAWRASQLAAELEAPLADLVLRASTLSIAAGFALGVFGWFALARRPSVGVACLLAGQLLGPAAVLADYVPTVREEFRAPQSDAMSRLQARVGDERMLFLTSDDVRPNVNLLYGLRTPMSYDALEVGRLARLRERAFGRQGYRGLALKASERALQLFGVRYVATRGDWAPVGTEFAVGERAETDLEPYLRAEMLQRPAAANRRQTIDSDGLQQRFAVDHDGLDGIALRIIVDNGRPSNTLEVTLRDADTRESLATTSQALRGLRRLAGDEAELVLRFDARADSSTRVYELDVRTTTPQATIEVVRYGAPKRAGRADDEEPATHVQRANEWRLAAGSKALKGRILADASCASTLRRVEDLQSQTLFESTTSRGRAWIVTHAIDGLSAEDAFERVCSDAFDPYATVALEQPLERPLERPLDPTVPTSAPTLTRIREDATSSAWRTDADSRCIAVFAQTYYPGWRAYVNGVERPVLRANFAFCAVELEAGVSAIELTFTSESTRSSAWLSAAGVLLSGLMLAFGMRASRR